MKGSLYKRRDGAFELRVDAGPDPRTGRRRRVSRTHHGTSRDAHKALRALIAEVEAGRHTTTNATFGDLLDEFARLHLPTLADSTRLRYKGIIEGHLRPALGHVQLAKLTPHHLEAMYGDLMDNDLSPRTVRQVHAVARKALGAGVRWRWMPDNPAIETERPKVHPAEVDPPSFKVVRRLIIEGENRYPELGAFVFLAASTGARRGELCGLRWTDLALDALPQPIVSIARSVNDAGGRLVVKDTKTHAMRRVPIDGGTVEALRRHHSRMEARAGKASAVLGISAYVFSNAPDGSTPWRPQQVTDAFRDLCKRLKITGVRLHDLRHWQGSEQIAAGTDVRTVSERLGHKQTSTTLNVYAHKMPLGDQRAVAVMAERFAPDPARESAPPLSAEGVTE